MRKTFTGSLVLVLFAALLFVGGCAKKTVQTEEAAVTPPAQPVEPAEPAQPAVPPGPALGMEEPLETPAVPELPTYPVLEGRTSAPMLPIYFDFDKYNIRPDQKPRILANADYLKNNPSRIIRIEGNCDERGTNEYNMALGERRARSAKKYLVNLGISPDRIRTISYGEERPLNRGHDEHAWSQNRRDDFVIIN